MAVAPVATSIRNPADLANNSFARMGFKLQVGSLLDGSSHAQYVLNTYAQARDKLLASFDFDFAERAVDLDLINQAPLGGYFPPQVWDPALYPPPGAKYQYAFPSDAIKIRSLKFQPLFTVNIDPRPMKFSEYNNATLGRRTIVTSVPAAVAVYTGRILDPMTWSVEFSEALSADLAVLLGPVLVGMESTRLTVPEAQVAASSATTERR